MENNTVYKGKRVSVIGAGVSGRSLAELARKLGAEVFVSDLKKITEESVKAFDVMGIDWEEEGNTERVLACDEILLSSGVSQDIPILKLAVSKGIPVTGELDFVYPYMSGKIIAVTGSNGKTTTASMTGFLLERSGAASMTGGNIGNPAANAAYEKNDFLVLELSSFQLNKVNKFKCDIAVVTNLAPDHIDWHGSYEKYVEAKANVIRSLAPNGNAIYQYRDSKELNVPEGMGYPLSWGKSDNSKKGIYIDRESSAVFICVKEEEEPIRLFDFDAVKLLGSHNIENTAMASAALVLLGHGPADPAIISDYQPPKHRCAFAGSIKGITFVDDSKGTNVAATVTAMSSLEGSKIIILGGQGKGEDYAPLAEAVLKYAKSAVLVGAEKKKIASALDAAGYVSYTIVSTMEEAVEKAYRNAVPGDTVLLSPACTSWDMYPNYGARGDHFCELAKGIIERDS
ncbi:MAG: UDP-N-acetylmuramoyl-L-alanine--D-glutamate ligase [Synergistaceae bacterium]|jgi:UDP-N-acetylmuramoylalanine--D-glutamate ligase|nr:UDP-N-acetylmuramoyl-L-alanine--D-glutamate ligase [Synergistaceae bacterium]